MIASCGKEFADALKGARGKRVLFTVRREYFDAIVAGEKREEIRADTPNWRWMLGDKPPKIAVFICGRNPAHRRWIIRIYKEKPSKVLGRPVSEQGALDLKFRSRHPRDERDCIVVALGDVYNAE